jgi:thioredoxin reductase (NADPH)
MFFCKDCDGYRVHGKAVAIYGWTNEAVDYALAMLLYTPCVFLVTDGREPAWDGKCATWLTEYHLPVHTAKIVKVRRRGSMLRSLELQDGKEIAVRVLFTTRGDHYYNELAEALGAELDDAGEIKVDADCRTSVPGLFAAGCVTPANCQMVIAAGQGATAAQAINRELHDEALASHHLRLYRRAQLNRHRVKPRVNDRGAIPTAQHLRGKNPINQFPSAA